MAVTIDDDLDAVLPCAPGTVRRTGPLDRDGLVRLIRAGEPAVIEGAMDDWAAVDRWRDRRRLEELVGADTVVRCRRIVTGGDRYHEDFYPMRFADLLDDVFEAEHPRHYLTQALVFEPVGFYRAVAREQYPALLTELFVDCAVPAFMRPEEIAEGVLWMGSGGAVTPLHFDPVDNVHATVVGRKRWVLFPPDQASGLLIGDDDGRDCMLSSLDDLVSDGVWRGGPIDRVLVVETGPGDLLYLPAGWGHHVCSSNEPSIAVNFWFGDPGSLDMHRKYLRYQSIERYGVHRRLRRAVYAAGLLAGLTLLRLGHRVAPTRMPRPDIGVGEALYERHTAT